MGWHLGSLPHKNRFATKVWNVFWILVALLKFFCFELSLKISTAKEAKMEKLDIGLINDGKAA